MGGNSPLPAGLSVSVPSNATAGVHTLMVSATYGALTHTYSFPFYVADYSGSVSTLRHSPWREEEAQRSARP